MLSQKLKGLKEGKQDRSFPNEHLSEPGLFHIVLELSPTQC